MKNIIISTYAAEKGDVPEAYAGAVRPWLDFCHDRKLRCSSFYVDFSRRRDTSRWQAKDRQRCFLVRSANTLEIVTSSKTLVGAIAAAQRMIKAAE